MNDNILLTKYEGRRHLSLLRVLDQHKTRAERAETNLHDFNEAFSWLNEQEWFKNHHHELIEYLKSLEE